MSVNCLSPVPASSPAESEDEAQYLLNPPAPPTRFSPSYPHKRPASQVDFLSLAPRACRQCRVPTPPLPPLIPAVIVQPPLPAPTLSSRTSVCSGAGGSRYRCRHTCGSGEDCRHEEGWKIGSITGHEQSANEHPQCTGSSCPAHPLLKHRDHPDRRGTVGRIYNQERRDWYRAKQHLLPLPTLPSDVLTPPTSAPMLIPLAPGPIASSSLSATCTATTQIRPPPLPSQGRDVILYITEPSFKQSSYKEASGDASFHYALYDHKTLTEPRMRTLGKLLFKGRDVVKDTKDHVEDRETRTVCYMYNYVSHM
jgi:hypothetical protein